MNKIQIVAVSEFGTLVRSKAFLISLMLMPILSLGSVYLVRMTRDAASAISNTPWGWIEPGM